MPNEATPTPPNKASPPVPATPPTPPTPSPKTAQPSSAGLIVVALIAFGALALGTYAVFLRQPEVVQAGGSTVTVSSPDIDNRLAALEQRRAAQERRLTALEESVAELEKKPATPPAPAGGASTEGAVPAVTAPVGPTPPPVMAAGPPLPTTGDNAGSGPFHVVPNAVLKGRLGRLIVEFPQANELRARTEAFKAGDTRGLRTDFGNVDVEMTAGTYDFNIGGAIVANVPIQSGHDTRVHVGVLRLNATGNTRFELFPPGEKRSLGTYFGQTDVGLPVGTFEVEVNGQRETVTIPSGGIAEY